MLTIDPKKLHSIKNSINENDWPCLFDIANIHDGNALFISQFRSSLRLRFDCHEDLRDPFVEEAFEAIVYPHHPILKDYVNTRTRSGYNLDRYLANIEKLSSKRVRYSFPSIPEYEQAVHDAITEFGRRPSDNLLDLVPFDAVNLPPNAYAGFGYTGTREENFQLSLTKAHSHLDEFSQITTIEQLPFTLTPFIGLTRTQEASLLNPKVRMVWSQSSHNLLIEGSCFQEVIQRYLNRSGSHYACGLSLQAQEAFLRSLGEEEDDVLIANFDYSSFDLFVEFYEIEIALRILALHLRKTKSISLHLSYIRANLLIKKIVLPDSSVATVIGSIPSGSYLTNVVDSIINFIRIRYLTLRTGVSRGLPIVLGDDSLVKVSAVPTQALLDQFSSEIGDARLELSKSLFVQSTHMLHFLGHDLVSGMLIRNEYRAASLCMHVERQKDCSPALSVTRLFAIHVDSGKAHNFILDSAAYLVNKYHVTELIKDTSYRTLVLDKI